MMLGLSLSTFTLLHVVVSLVAIAAGLVWLVEMTRGDHGSAITAVFLAMTVLTSVTGFMFPQLTLSPAVIFGLISLTALAIALAALYWADLKGGWRTAYVVTAMLALYLNVFVLIVQAFQKVPALSRLAPTQTEIPFALTQVAALLAFLVSGTLALRRFRPSTSISGL
jgi:hypothetical protein